METTNLNSLKINVLTQAQYDAAEKDSNQIYLITDNVANYLALTGGQMTGEIILHGDPINDLGAATKQYVDNGLNGKVDAVSGKGLSTNDYTTAEKNKLAGIATGATANTGTITAVQANGTNVATSGTANIPAATTSKYGVTKLSSATNSTSTSLAATASAVKAAYDLANGKANASHTQSASTITDLESYINGLGYGKIATGSYTGNGRGDSGSPRTVTLPFSPSLLLIFGYITEDTVFGLYGAEIDSYGTNGAVQYSVVLTQGLSIEGKYSGSSASTSGTATIANLSGTTLSLYSYMNSYPITLPIIKIGNSNNNYASIAPNFSLNRSNALYNYIAFA